MNQLPDLPQQKEEAESEGVAIRKRLGQTRFLTPQPPPAEAGTGDSTSAPGQRHALSRDLSLLYRLALDMGSAGSYEELCRIVLDALLEAIPAEVGAILSVARDGNGRTAPPAGVRVASAEAGKSLRGLELEVTAHRHRDSSLHDYKRVSEYVSNEVLASREAILAEDVARDRYLRNRESLSELGATSLICAPIVFGDRVLGLIHLYCTNPHKALDAEDLEFAVAVAKQLGGVIHQMQRQASLTRREPLAARTAARRERADRRKSGDEGDRAADRPRRRHQRHLPDSRRKRLRQGAGGPRHSLLQPAQGRPDSSASTAPP